MFVFFLLRLRLFQSFKSFRVLVCGGDGSISWVLSEIDKLGLHAQVCSGYVKSFNNILPNILMILSIFLLVIHAFY